MKAKVAILAMALAALVATTGNACDEDCLKQAAEKKHDVQFPGYISWSYCDDTRMDFMTSTLRSLENYKANHFDVRYRGGIRNIINYIEQREEWLKECDQYLTYTGKGRIFEDAETTEKIFGAMDRVKSELTDLANGVVYVTDPGEDPRGMASERFDQFFKVVEDHKTLMHLKGKYVFR